MNILILGGTGNLSSVLADTLLNKGHIVTLLTTGRTPVAPQFLHINADRYNMRSLKSTLASVHFDVAIDFLGYKPEDCQSAYDSLRGNIKHYIFISSATVYSKPHTKLPITETHPTGNQFSEYAQNKLACEQYLNTLNDPSFEITIVRPTHTFGNTWIPSPLNGSDWTVPARILSGKPILVHDDGQTLWTITSASDFAEAISELAGNKESFGETYNITSDQCLSWNSIYYEIGLALGKQPNIVYIPSDFLEKLHRDAKGKLSGDKANHGVFDNTKIKRLLPNWECKKSFRTAIRESVAWYMEHEDRRIPNIKTDAEIESLITAWNENQKHRNMLAE